MSQSSESKTIRIINEKGTTTMEISALGRRGNDIVIMGRLMGAWPSEMYIKPEDTWLMLDMLFKNWSLIIYVLCLPFIILKRKMIKNIK